MPKYQNTFKLEPEFPFSYKASDKILYSTMSKLFEKYKYSVHNSSEICQETAAQIRDKLYKTDFDR